MASQSQGICPLGLSLHTDVPQSLSTCRRVEKISQAGGGQPRTEELWGPQRQVECRLTNNPRAGHQLSAKSPGMQWQLGALTNAAPLALSTH